MKSGFRNTQWDPVLLFAQIVAIQSILYVTLGCIVAVMDIFVDANHTLDHLFQYHVSVWPTNYLNSPFPYTPLTFLFCRKFMLPTPVAVRWYSHLCWTHSSVRWRFDSSLAVQNYVWTLVAHFISFTWLSVGFIMVHFRPHSHGGSWMLFVQRWCALAVNFSA